MCDSHGTRVAESSLKTTAEAQELHVKSNAQRVRHEDSTKVERYRRDVWSVVGRGAGVDADRAVSDVVWP